MEFYQLLSFGRQLGLAVMGAASLWAMVFIFLAQKKKADDFGGIFLDWMGLRMRWMVIGGGLLALGTWFMLTLMAPVSAHEGVTLITEKTNVINAMLFMTPLYGVIALLLVFMVVTYKKPSFLYSGKTGISWFYILTFLAASIGISYYTDLRVLETNERIFHIFHGFHSIFTLGTVLCLDLIFLSTQNAPFVQRHVIPLFPQISKVIWVGLSLDLMSTLLIFPEAIVLSPRFYFAQIVVGILIINGILLSGLITRRMLKNVEEGHKEKVAIWEKFAAIAGAISATSWMSITFVDSFHNMTIPLHILLGIYVCTIVGIVIVHELWNKIDTHAEGMHALSTQYE